MPPLAALLRKPSASAQEEAAGTLMNLAACDANKDAIISAGALPPLVALLGSGSAAAREHAAQYT